MLMPGSSYSWRRVGSEGAALETGVKALLKAGIAENPCRISNNAAYNTTRDTHTLTTYGFDHSKTTTTLL
jgi:hypothetical protein